MFAKRLGALVAVAVPLTLVACSTDGDSGEELDYEDSPMAEAFEAIDSFAQMSEEEMQAEYQEQLRQAEDKIAACMAEQGFDYIPVEPAEAGLAVEVEGNNADSEEYIAQYGYGITTYAEQQTSDEEVEDPNDEVVDAMSEAQQDAYYLALYGEEDDSGNEATQGCFGQAQAAVAEQDPAAQVWEDPQFAEFFAAMEQFYEDLESDSDVAEIDAEWSNCMADAGYPGLFKQSDGAQSIYDAVEEAWGEEDPDDAAMAELSEREIATATADLACRAETDYSQRVLERRFELEREFVDQWQAEIDAVIAAYQQLES
ncbi:MAG: hypothetical protein ACK5H2_01775 [Beutenbergiaceae bacterium]